MAAIMSGSMQIGTPTPSIFVQSIDGGIDGLALAATNVIPDDSKSGVLGRMDAGIKTPADFIGKKVGVPGIGGLLHIIFQKWLMDAKVDPKRVVFIETSLPQASDVLRGGQVDAVVSVDPFYSRVIEQKTGYLIAEHTKSLPENTIASVFATSQQWAKANPAAVKAFQEAVQEAVKYIKTNPDGTRESIARYTKLPPPVVANLTIPNVTAKLNAKDLDFWIDLMRTQGYISGKIDTAKAVAPWQGGD